MLDNASQLDKIIRQAEPIDWANGRAAYRIASGILREVASVDGLVGATAREVTGNARTRTDCESYDTMDKIVLWANADRSTRLRLHVFHPGYSDRPHNHRWSFASRLLAGQYLHSIYGSEDEVLAHADSPRVQHAYALGPGGDYYLAHSLVHSLSTETTTVSLVLRGPSVKDSYFTLDGASTLWSTGADRESGAERQAKTMTDDGVDRVLATLGHVGILA